jgi:hypothetical protein
MITPYWRKVYSSPHYLGKNKHHFPVQSLKVFANSNTGDLIASSMRTAYMSTGT